VRAREKVTKGVRGRNRKGEKGISTWSDRIITEKGSYNKGGRKGRSVTFIAIMRGGGAPRIEGGSVSEKVTKRKK